MAGGYVIVVSPAESPSPARRVVEGMMAGVAATVVAVASGHPAVAEIVGGALIIAIAILAGSLLASRVVREPDPGRVLLLDFLLVLVVVIGLFGVGVMAAAMP